MTRSYEEIWSYQCGGSVISVAATPNGSRVVAGSVDRRVYLLKSTGEPIWPDGVELDFEVWAVDITPDGGTIVVGTANKFPSRGSVWVLDRHGQRISRFATKAPVWSVSASDDGEWLAATCWNNVGHVFRRSGQDYKHFRRINKGRSGLYGAQFSNDGESCAFAAYGLGVLLWDRGERRYQLVPLDAGLYNVAFDSESRLVVGRHDGRFSIYDSKTGRMWTSPILSARPLCGVATSLDGRLVASGSFDGRVYLTSASGRLLWKLETDGEVWSTSVSSDGSFVVLGSGDGKVYFVKNRCPSAAIEEIEALEKRALSVMSDDLAGTIGDLTRAYMKYGVWEFGVDFFQNQLADLTPARQINDSIRILLRGYVAEEPLDYEAHLKLGGLLFRDGMAKDAIPHLQIAAEDAGVRLQALTLAGDAFRSLNLSDAALACFLRANEPYLDQDRKRVLYNLARSYEDHGQWASAKTIYQVLVSWDSEYRKAWDRLTELPTAIEESSTSRTSLIDYTGLTVSLLGPDVPRANEVDDRIRPVVAARSERELAIEPIERVQMQAALSAAEPYLTRPSAYSNLEYTIEAYLKYDYSLPEDEIKKNLELIQCLNYLSRLSSSGASLDVGTATGRYPSTLIKLGWRAVGIDIESAGFQYALEKLGDQMVGSTCIRGTAASLPFSDATFDIVTCMMGTLAHFPDSVRVPAMAEFYRVLRPHGLAIISTWDIECPHLSYLSMYTQSQREALRKNSLSTSETCDLLGSVGFLVEERQSFCLLPDALVYDLGVEEMAPEGIRRVIEMEMAARSIFPEMHGQMIMLVAQRP